jgi:hypothetical protein
MQVSGLGFFAVECSCSPNSRIRHKKCDEAKPTCSKCVEGGWKCDLVSAPLIASSRGPQDVTPPIRGLAYPSARPLLDNERGHMEYFHVICAKEFSLYFELPVWENIILESTLAEPALHHAAIAIGALSRSRYHPAIWEASPTTSFSIRHYGLAIQALYSQLDRSSQSLKLAILASIVFSLIESLLGLDSRLELHLQAGSAMLKHFYMKRERSIAISTQTSSSSLVEDLPAGYDLLANAIFQLTTQVNLLWCLGVHSSKFSNNDL